MPASQIPAQDQDRELPFVPRPDLIPYVESSEETADCRGQRIGILIVAYNAVTTLPAVLKRIPPVVWRNVEEIAVFDDASQDSTYELALGMKAQRELPKLKVLRHPKNLGYGGNQKAGYRYFMDEGFDIVVLLHGDGQYAPEVLARLYAPLVEGHADAVFGSRMMKDYGGPRKGGRPLYKFVGNRILTTFENRALGLELTEFHSGYRAYNLHALKRIDFSRMTDDFHFDTEIIIKLHHQGFRILETPIPTYYGSELCYVDGMKYARDVYRAVRRYKATARSVRCYPEYAEYFQRYALKSSPWSSHGQVLRLVGSGKKVLDIGCGHGHMASLLVENGNQVTGVDELPQPEHRTAFTAYHQADLDDARIHLPSLIPDQRFDTVLMLDVLEHLRKPELLLEQAHRLIEPHGQCIVSLPNIANLAIRLTLLAGRFSYADRGILDRTHLRFYTLKTARHLLESTSWEVCAVKPTNVPLELALGLRPQSLAGRITERFTAALTRIFPKLLGYQFVFVLRPLPTKKNAIPRPGP
jgi:glycosyltransferase involved in cell wall biosynthesis